jgi:NAD(P)-dependent dehydrogenase (short-subunit alcohol dehydrogenase family)
VSLPVAIVTGAGKGIGRAIARELARRGYDLALIARTEADLRETAKDAFLIPGDVADPNLAEKAMVMTAKQFGRVDVLINNAGYAPLRSIEELTIEQWQQTIAVNLSATFYFCKAVWPIMRRQGGGVIVNISSAASRDPFKGFAAYGAAKAGVNLLGHALAREGEEFGIRVHTIAPAAVETEMFRTIATEEQYPRDKTLDPTEVARAVAECIDGNLRHTSGEVIHLHTRLS